MDSLVIPRADTVHQLTQTLYEVGVVHVRGTPASGKTVLARLLKEHFERNNVTVLYFENWKAPGRYEFKIMSAGFKQDSRFGQPSYIQEGDYVIIMDDAETSFDDMEFWNGLVTKALKRESRVQICLFSRYGCPMLGTDRVPYTLHQPGRFLPRHRVSILPSRMNGAPPFGLYFTRQEFDDVVRRYCAYSYWNPRLRLEEPAKDKIFDITRGHPGAVASILETLREVYREELGDHSFKLTEEQMNDCFNNLDFFHQISSPQFKRSLPGPMVSLEALQVLGRVFENKVIDYEGDNKGSSECYVGGLVQVDAIKGNRRRFYDRRERVVCVFPSGFHERYFKLAFTD
ncbi:hypothetical protein N7493_007737 [Penicillium malachiteum]|uniref:Uncharacterized protein n=1 Tax=Penicillium malachiteum TaxID=1324776 RepID=A0AAD6HIK8_9EURO|nr:hypothetical protein N7493_007737 [Penicillium malachiteum]